MDEYVEAIENGKIVRVPERYASTEGLLIIRRRQNGLGYAANVEAAKAITKPKFAIKKQSPHYLKNDLLSELKPNFHWELQKQRRLRNISRHQLAKLCGIGDGEIATLERGEIPDNFIALSKLEAFYGISVRK
jgi:ribosome-binding protein aMBF1 (putative translation factor)